MVVVASLITVSLSLPYLESKNHEAEKLMFEALVASYTVARIPIIPVACHKDNKAAVRAVCVAVSIIIGAIVLVLSSKGVGWSILVGGGVAGVQWLLIEVLL